MFVESKAIRMETMESNLSESRSVKVQHQKTPRESTADKIYLNGSVKKRNILFSGSFFLSFSIEED